VVGHWRGYLSGARCRLAYGPADATATHCLLLSKIQIGFTFLVPAHPGSSGKRAVKRVYVCVCYAAELLLLSTGQQSIDICPLALSSKPTAAACGGQVILVLANDGTDRQMNA